MNSKQNISLMQVMIIAILLIAVGWIGLYALIELTRPTLGPRWLFFFLVTIALSGTALPIIYFLHLRFPSTPSANANVMIREALMVGVYFDLIAWMQMGRVLNLALVIFIAVGLILIEILIRMSEKSRFKPEENEE